MTDPAPLTDEELAEIKARADGADPGPWLARMWHEVWTGPDNRLLAEDCYTDENAEFIAHARTDVPRLIAEVEQLRRFIRQGMGDPS